MKIAVVTPSRHRAIGYFNKLLKQNCYLPVTHMVNNAQSIRIQMDTDEIIWINSVEKAYGHTFSIAIIDTFLPDNFVEYEMFNRTINAVKQRTKNEITYADLSSELG